MPATASARAATAASMPGGAARSSARATIDASMDASTGAAPAGGAAPPAARVAPRRIDGSRRRPARHGVLDTPDPVVQVVEDPQPLGQSLLSSDQPLLSLGRRGKERGQPLLALSRG